MGIPGRTRGLPVAGEPQPSPTRWIALAAVLLTPGLACWKSPQPQPDERDPAPVVAADLTLYRFARVIPEPGTVIEGGAVLVEGKIFREILTGDRAPPPGARIVDLSRYTAIPGLIDVHTHLSFCWDPSWGERAPADPFSITSTKERLAPLVAENARRVLEIGITTVRDLGSNHNLDLDLAKQIEAGEAVGPRIFGAGDGIWSPLLNPDGVAEGSLGEAAGPEAVAAMVRREAAAGSRVIKLWASTGSDDDLSGRRTYSYEEIKAGVDAAHALGLTVAVHDTLGEVTEDIVRAGADSVEHPRHIAPELLVKMRERGVTYVPTIYHNIYYRDNIDRFGFSPDRRAAFDDFIADNVATARAAHKAGVNIAMGSDAVFTAFGQNTRELDMFVHDVGMTPMEALATATTNAARLLRVDDRLGAIRPGYLADMVVLDGDFSRIEDIHAVVMVIKEGAVVVDKLAPAAPAAP
ncbi:MAG TPA: amidohydrolase family protein [Nannocystis sp.]